MRVTFLSANTTSWGGSEELWATTAIALARDGHQVSVFKAFIDESQPRIRQLRAAGCRMHDLLRPRWLPRKVASFFARVIYPVITAQEVARLWLYLRLLRPELAVISQGGNYDGLLLAEICRRSKLPYVLVSQKAAEIYWTADYRQPRLRAVYESAKHCYFVSEANRRLTEEQLGFALPHASVVRNPFLVPFDVRTEWPDERDGLRLACVGRLFPAEKGQDILLRVLARDKWRRRPLSVTFFGGGPHRDSLERMAKLHGLTSVTFAGFVDDIGSIWSGHHALVLPSRCEGLPLVLVEAMLSARMGIATDVAGHGEVIADGETGFIAKSAHEDALDEAMERAWERRSEWRAIGVKAAERIRTLVPPDPARTFAAELGRVYSSQVIPNTPTAISSAVDSPHETARAVELA